MEEDWYAAKALFRVTVSVEPDGKPFEYVLFDERIVLLKGASEEEVLERATENAHRYAREGHYINGRGESVSTEYLGECHLSFIGGSPPEDDEELWGWMSVGSVTDDPRSFIRAHFGPELDDEDVRRRFFMGRSGTNGA